MSKSYQRTLLTAALPYANGPIHIGHLAGAYLPSDIYARFLRLKGEEVAFICGSDEHGAAITLRAKKDHKSPQEIVDYYHELNKKAFADFGIEFDIFHRTTSKEHHETAQEFFKDLEKKGEFEIKESEQFYDEEYQQFLADRYVSGTCPKCDYDAAYGDQCENCGSSLNPSELINPKSTLSGKTPVLKTTKHWFLPMQKHEEWLADFISKGELEGKAHHDPSLWRKQVIGQCKSWIDGGLHSRAMTRDLDWGVKVPLKDANGKVLYVWLDAPIGYISATKVLAKQKGISWEDYWKNDESRLIHFIGKDNIVFHCIIFPIILKTKGDYILPTNVPANEFLNLEGKKISTSRNWAIWLHEYLSDFPNRTDELRYVLNSIAPESKDSEFTWKDYQARVNNELVAIYGNFINRVLVLTHKYYKGNIPTIENINAYHDIIEELKSYSSKCTEKLERFQFRDAQSEALNIARLGNRFLAETEPWKLIKTDEEKVKSIMHIALQIAANCAIAFNPFLPHSSQKLSDLLNFKNLNWENIGRMDLLQPEDQINKAEHLFQKVEDEQIEQQINKLMKESTASKNQSEKESVEEKAVINFEDFTKVDLRVGTILSAEAVPKSSKLLKFEVDLGFEKRTILSGIAKHYNPEETIGKQVTVVTNLAPRKIMGIESQGMIIMAEDNSGKLSLIQPNTLVENGSPIS